MGSSQTRRQAQVPCIGRWTLNHWTTREVPILLLLLSLLRFVCLVSQSCLTLWPRRLQSTRILCPRGFSRQGYWSGLPCPPPRDLPNPGIKLGSPALQVDFYQLSYQGNPIKVYLTQLSEDKETEKHCSGWESCMSLVVGSKQICLEYLMWKTCTRLSKPPPRNQRKSWVGSFVWSLLLFW